MRKEWFTLPLVIIVLLASYFVAWFIDSGLYARITAIGIMATFTVVLAVATIWNIFVMRGLLRESKVASERARIAFESGLFREIVFSVMQLDTQRRMAPVGAEKRKGDVQDFTVGILRSLKKSDMPTYTRIRENIQKLWTPTGELGGTVGGYFREAVKKVEAEEKKEGEA